MELGSHGCLLVDNPYLSYYNTDTNLVNKERKRYFFARLFKSHVVQNTKEVICKSIQNHSLKEAYTPSEPSVLGAMKYYMANLRISLI